VPAPSASCAADTRERSYVVEEIREGERIKERGEDTNEPI
jgi:hypothetical protein